MFRSLQHSFSSSYVKTVGDDLSHPPSLPLTTSRPTELAPRRARRFHRFGQWCCRSACGSEAELKGDSLQRLDDGKEGEDEEGESAPVDKLGAGLVDDYGNQHGAFLVENGDVDSHMANRAQVMAAAPAASPSLLAKA